MRILFVVQESGVRPSGVVTVVIQLCKEWDKNDHFPKVHFLEKRSKSLEIHYNFVSKTLGFHALGNFSDFRRNLSVDKLLVK